MTEIERAIQERLIFLEELRKEAEGIQARIVEVQMLKDELDRTIESLEFFEKAEGDVEALLNLGGGVFAYVDVKNSKKMLVDVGAGVVVEKEVKEAIETLRNKKQNVEDTEKKLRELLTQIAGQMEKLQREISELAKSAGKE
ncbi:prefoldin alpha subunit/eukaryotic subunit 5 [Geoglobus ahangari]|uniref:Prefoldin subunit alpha n=1 Tax=Geoglobus ahangari TaxID=113653 RepID=A0A0F7IHQ3_9EURY|nr:prefoldin subunit alpha [Geoglobus ahangari]AKG92498.1 prefoldin alpha subunit/eukaryotic subunit 5 [Geoglobus ahangari]NOY12113.1 prefoldin subunit alpha [Archaeoglobi archaeon]